MVDVGASALDSWNTALCKPAAMLGEHSSSLMKSSTWRETKLPAPA